MHRIPEADWKVFKRHHLVAHEKFVNQALSEISDVMHGDSRSRIEMFHEIAELVKTWRKEEYQLFSDYRRSTAMSFLRIWLYNGLLTQEQVMEYSDEVREILSR